MKKVLLSFDIEEFDMPGEYGKKLSVEEQLQVSRLGTDLILDILLRYKVRATFFSTVVFAEGNPDIISRIVNEGHELASHGYNHSRFCVDDLLQSKTELEEMSGQQIQGFRMARMMPVDDKAIAAAGYSYNSSLNPVYLPGRYNNFFKKRTLFTSGTLQQLPASATPGIRFPLFWLSFHNLPLWLYKTACRWTINKDHYLNIYFHPWEFMDLRGADYGLPAYVTKNSGRNMIKRFKQLLAWMQEKEYRFETIGSFLHHSKNRSIKQNTKLDPGVDAGGY